MPEDLEAELIAQARARGFDVSQYVEHLLREHVAAPANAGMSTIERADAWRKSTEGLPQTPPLSDTDISRENIYRHRG